MGICYSSIGSRENTEQDDEEGVVRWWKSKDDRNSKKTSFDVGKFGGGGGGGGGGAAADESAMLQISGRLFANGSSNIGSLYTQQGKKGTNQDAMIVWENFSSRSDTVFCGVFDGHGPYGHMVAKKVRDSLPLLLCSQWKANSNRDQSEDGNETESTNIEECMDEDCCEYLENEENEKVPEMYHPLKQSMLKAFKLMDKELKFHPIIDCFCSGTTAVTLVKQVDDSNAMLSMAVVRD